MPRNFRWQIEDVVAGCAMPSVEDIRDLRRMGISAIVSLETPPRDVTDEKRRLGFEEPVEDLAFPDFTAPTIEKMERFCRFVDQMRAKGKRVVVHCGAGIGRTGTMLAAYLVSKSMTADEAIDEVRAKMPGSLENLQQELGVRNYEAYVHARKIPPK